MLAAPQKGEQMYPSVPHFQIGEVISSGSSRDLAPLKQNFGNPQEFFMIKQITCPICHKPAIDSKKSPFCSDRCRKIDFFRWWDGRYTIATKLQLDLDSEGDLSNYDPADSGLAADGAI